MLVRLARQVIPAAVALAGLFILMSALVALWLLMVPSETTFNVVAETERVVMNVQHQVPWRWPLNRMTLEHGSAQQTVSGSLQIGFPVQVVIERVGLGKLSIDVTSAAASGGTCQPAVLYGTDEEAAKEIGCDFRLIVSDPTTRTASGESTVFTLEGDIAIGRPIGFETRGSGTALLRSGRVTLREHSVFTRTLYETGVQQLDAGDFLIITQRNRNVPGRGFVVADERPAMTAAFRVVGQEAAVERPGGGRYPLSTGVFSRFANDDVFRVTTAIVAVLIGLITLSAAIVEGLDTHERSANDVARP